MKLKRLYHNPPGTWAFTGFPQLATFRGFLEASNLGVEPKPR